MIRLSHNGARFELFGTKQECLAGKREGFHYDYSNRVWWTGNTELARKFEFCADASAKVFFSRIQVQIDASKAVDANVTIPSPEGKTYLPFQKAGVVYALNRPRVLIADEMGLGKTIQACGIINADPSIKNILIVCPNSLKLNWGRELQNWLVHKLTGAYVNAGDPFPNTQIVIINYDVLKKYREEIEKRQWDMIVYDECHYMKTPDSQRTEAALGEDPYTKVKKKKDRTPVKPPLWAKRIVFLTGTPILNRPVEMWPMLRVIDPEGLGRNYWWFVRRYCNAKKDYAGWDVSGASNLDEFQNKLRTTIMIRRLKRDVLKELPPKRRQVIPIEFPKTVDKTIQDELQFYAGNSDKLEQARIEAEAAQKRGDKNSYARATSKLDDAIKVLFEQMARVRYKTGVAKIPYAVQFIKDRLEEQEKIVVFCHHNDVCNQVAESFGNAAVKMHEGVSLDERQAAVDRFQTDPTCKVIVGTYGTMGVGWTLVAASYCLMIEEDWVPANMSQAEDRLHRIGQHDSVLVQHLVFDGSLDAKMAKRTVEKQDIIDQAVGG